jgi:hypothetical protein
MEKLTKLSEKHKLHTYKNTENYVKTNIETNNKVTSANAELL